MMISKRWPQGVLFDLDGTLVDTAPQITSALNDLLLQERRQPLPSQIIRANVSAGTNALVRLAFPDASSQAQFEEFRDRLLNIYYQDYLTQSQLFSGVQQVLTRLADLRIPWGIVTNKIGWLTNPLVQALQLLPAPACVISGDTAARPKPYADPLILAAQQLGAEARNCVYVGDARNDVIAGRAAGMCCLAVTYGYSESKDSPITWQADDVIESPLELEIWLIERLVTANHEPR